MKDYKKYINALRKCAKEHDNDRTFTGNIIVSDLCRDTANLLEEVEQEQKSGKWINGVCDNCKYDWGKDAPIASVPNYCPNCGAKMVEPQESEKVNCKSIKCYNCINHNYCDFEPQEREDKE